MQVAVLEQQVAGVTGAGSAERSRRNESGRPSRALWAPAELWVSLCWMGAVSSKKVARPDAGFEGHFAHCVVNKL